MQAISDFNTMDETAPDTSRRLMTEVSAEVSASEGPATDSPTPVLLATMNWSWSNLMTELCGTVLWVGGLMILPWLAVTLFTSVG